MTFVMTFFRVLYAHGFMTFKVCDDGVAVEHTLKADDACFAGLGARRQLLIEMRVVEHGDRTGLLRYFRLRILREVDFLDGYTARCLHPLVYFHTLLPSLHKTHQISI